MKSFIKIALIIILSVISGLNFVYANGDGGQGGNSGGGDASQTLEGMGTLVPICQEGGEYQCNLETARDSIKDSMDGSIERNKRFSEYVQDIIKYALGFLTVVGVIYIIYAGLLLLTSAGEEEKMTKARKNIMFVMVGFAVVYLAYPIVSWLVNAINQ
ncbi:MAG: pilin [Candidatus Gracilibacteria bacterium]|nr:pilin [Candidatus Gracilibacteria bacterium]